MISRRSILTQALCLAAGAGAAWLVRDRLLWPGPTVAFDLGEASSAWQAFAVPRQLLPIVQLSAHGVPLNALLDSGAERSAIDAAVASRLGVDRGFSLPVVAFGVGGRAEAGRTVSLDVEIGGLALKGLQVASLGLGPIASVRGLGAPLVLGQDVLRQLVAEIDFPARRLRFHDRQVYVAPKDLSALPVRRSGGALAANVRVDGAGVSAVLDTGASAALSLSTSQAQRLGLLSRAVDGQATSVVLGGVIRSQVVTAAEVLLAGETLRDVEVQIYPDQRLPGFPTAVLGVEALRRFRVVLDYGARRVLLRAQRDTHRRRELS